MRLSKPVAIIAVFLAVAVVFALQQGLGKNNIENDQTGHEIYLSLSPTAKKLYYEQSEGLTKPVPERLVELDGLTIGCFGAARVMQMSGNGDNLGGQCCGVLKDIQSYDAQLAALQVFIEQNGNVALIPPDPYDVPVEHAKKLISFNEILLNSAQQGVYDKALRMSHHGGPCCCRCWKWDMMSGLAKKLIVDHGWDEHKIAELWDTSSSCGHKEDTNMFQHYDVDHTEH